MLEVLSRTTLYRTGFISNSPNGYRGYRGFNLVMHRHNWTSLLSLENKMSPGCIEEWIVQNVFRSADESNSVKPRSLRRAVVCRLQTTLDAVGRQIYEDAKTIPCFHLLCHISRLFLLLFLPSGKWRTSSSEWRRNASPKETWRYLST